MIFHLTRVASLFVKNEDIFFLFSWYRKSRTKHNFPILNLFYLFANSSLFTFFYLLQKLKSTA